MTVHRRAQYVWAKNAYGVSVLVKEESAGEAQAVPEVEHKRSYVRQGFTRDAIVAYLEQNGASYLSKIAKDLKARPTAIRMCFYRNKHLFVQVGEEPTFYGYDARPWGLV